MAVTAGHVAVADSDLGRVDELAHRLRPWGRARFRPSRAPSSGRTHRPWIIYPEGATVTERDGYEHGVRCWVDTWQEDPDTAATFYAGVFGWDVDKRTRPVRTRGTTCAGSARAGAGRPDAEHRAGGVGDDCRPPVEAAEGLGQEAAAGLHRARGDRVGVVDPHVGGPRGRHSGGWRRADRGHVTIGARSASTSQAPTR